MSSAIDFQAAIARESTRFHQALSTADPDARVPSCPDWNAADLLWHLTEVQLFWGTVIRDQLDAPDRAEAAKPPRAVSYPDLLAQFTAANQTLLDTLAANDDDTPAWTWADDHSVGFIRRRQAHEALIHRLDAESVAGAVTDLEPELAADGVDEALRVMYGGYPQWAAFTGGPTGRIAATDVGRSWDVTLGRFAGTSPNSGKTYDNPTLEVGETTGAPDFTASGTAADLDAWLWGRPTLEPLTFSGDADAIASFRAVIAEGVQ